MAATSSSQEALRLSSFISAQARSDVSDRTNYMRVEVIYFAEARELAGRPGESLSLPSGSSSMDAVSFALRTHRRLNAIAEHTRVVVNGKLVRKSFKLHEGDTVALLPPSCGG